MRDSSTPLSRRKLLSETSTAAIVGAITGQTLANAPNTAIETPADELARKILNYNPKMKYRRLGKTGLMFSEVSLGGHWKGRNAEGFWADFANDKLPEDVAKNRTDVVSACIDAGVNYVDITTAAECLAYGAALKGRRAKFIVGADDHRLCLRNRDNLNVETQTRNMEECLRRMNTDYLDIWRVQARQTGGHPMTDLEPAIEAAVKARKAGKIRHFGVSSHNREWLKQVIETYPQVEMVVFPVTAMTKEKGLPVKRENVVEREQPFANAKDQSTSIFEAVRRHNVGVVTIKPFAGGNLFGSFQQKATFPVLGVGLKDENDLARLTLQCILTRYDEITCTVPGLTTVYEVDNAVRASYQRDLAMTPAEKLWLDDATASGMASLPQEYRWLREWDVI